MKLQILHLEDNSDDVELVRHSLARQGLDFELHAVATSQEYLSALKQKRFDVILSDSGLPGYDSRAALVAAQARSPNTPFVIVSASDSALEGSAAHVSKANISELGKVIQRACEGSPVEYVRDLERRVEQRSVELDVVTREFDSFLYAVAHDLRSPLITIDGFCQVLQETAGTRLNTDDHSHLERIGHAAARMRRLIEDLMVLSRIVRAPLLRVETDLSAMAAAVVQELRAGGGERTAEIVIAPSLAASGDPALLRVVLANLLGNAWKFTSKRAAARIELGKHVDAVGREVFFVRDNGAGFDPGYAERLFAPFTRCHSQQEFPGTGIGLASAQRVIHRHGGQIWAESRVDQGASFFFTLPRG
jgi:signal transduction histidine kinase